jgi:CubicO group peptidase (beta-lactamase class C family)
VKTANLLKSVLVIFWIVSFSSCLPDGESKTSINFAPQEINDGWELSDPALQGINPEMLQDIYEMMFDRNKFLTSRSLLIVKNGKLVSESYFVDKNDLHKKSNVQGITKSILSLMSGFAWDRGLFLPEDTLYNFLPGYFDGDKGKRDISVEHLLTMTTGLAWDNSIHTIDLFNDSRYPSSVRIVLSKALLAATGTGFAYNHGTPQLLIGLLGKVYDYEDTDSIVHGLFEPLGIDDFVWEKHADGLHIGGLGLHLKPRDLARIGQFCLQNGVWKGERLVSEEWIRTSTTAKIGPEITGSFMHYGYYWWVHPQNNAFFGMGAGGAVPVYSSLRTTCNRPHGQSLSRVRLSGHHP